MADTIARIINNKVQVTVLNQRSVVGPTGSGLLFPYLGAAAASAAEAEAWADAAEADAASIDERLTNGLRMPDGLRSIIFAGRDNDGIVREHGYIGVDSRLDIDQTEVRMPGWTVTSRRRLEITSKILVLDPAGGVVGWIDPTDTASTEVVEARGSQAELGDRLDASLYPSGRTRRMFNQNRLRQFHYRAAKLMLPTPEAVQNVVAIVGDSFSDNATRYTRPLTEEWMAAQGDAGGGWTGFGFGTDGTVPYALGGNQPGAINGNVRATYFVEFVGTWAKTYTLSPSPDICHATSSTAGNRIKATFPAAPVLSGCRLFWVGTANGVIRYSWDNGSTWTSLNVQGAVGDCHYADLTGFPSGAGFLLLEVVSGTCSLAGVDWRSAANGLRLHNLGVTGSRLQYWATQAANPSWKAAIAALGINTLEILHGTNDQLGNRSTAQFAADMNTVIDAVQSAVPGADIVVVMPPENQLGNSIKMKDLAVAAAEVAEAQGAAFYDLQGDFGSADNSSEYGPAGAIPLFNVDLTHPEILTGGRVIVSAHDRFYFSA